MKARELPSLLIAALALALSSVTAYLQFHKSKDFSVFMTYESFPSLKFTDNGTIKIADARAFMHFINNGSDPVAVYKIRWALENPGSDGGILEPADNIPNTICAAGKTLGGQYVEAPIKPFTVAPGSVIILEVDFPPISETVSKSWTEMSRVLTCSEFYLIDRDGLHVAVTPFMKFNGSGGTTSDRPPEAGEKKEDRPYLLLPTY